MKARWLLVLLPLLLCAASPPNYVLVCSTSCVMLDGTTQPAGTVVQRILWNGTATYVVPGMNIVADTGQAVYHSPTTITQISKPALLALLTTPEKSGILTAAGTVNSDAWSILVRFNATAFIDVGAPQTQADFATLVADGLLTQQRATAVIAAATVVVP